MSSVAIGPDKDGQEVRVAVTDVILLKLPENPATGVRWDFEQLQGPLELLSDKYEKPVSEGIGAMTHRLLTLQPKGPGHASVRLKRWQAWEGSSTIDAKFSCDINITKD